MQKKFFPCFLAFCFLCQINFAQPIVNVDAVALLQELPLPGKTLGEVYQRVYPANSTSPKTLDYYQNWSKKLENYVQQVQTLTANFYRQNPLGHPQDNAQTSNSKVSSSQKEAMQRASNEMAQKLLSDPSFAQQFSKMSEAEQQQYITNQLGKNGIKPVNGVPNSTNTAPAGMDVDWMGMSNELIQSLLSMELMEIQAEVQERYAQKHGEIQNWAEAAIKKLPLIELGEYGRDHDPQKVKSIQQQARDKHAELANAMLVELQPFFLKVRKSFIERVSTLNSAFKQVAYGQNYNFGMFYAQVLQAQALMLSAQHSILTNEITMMEECAHWEWEHKNMN